MPTPSASYTLTDKELIEARASGVSWGAIFAGATAAAALSLILLILGVGLGLSAVSPWSYNAAAIGVSTIIWIAFVQLAASGIGGYIAGRLRVRWASVQGDEVYFRDTAHGLLSWALASLFTVALLTGAVSNILGSAANLGATAAAPALASVAGTYTAKHAGDETSTDTHNPTDYFVDLLLRSDQAAADIHAEVNRIFITDLQAGKLTAEDRTYLATLIAKRTGISQPEAEARVDDIYARATKAIADAKEAADKARKAAAHSALWMFIALLLGAFIASFTATIGGRLRDNVNT